MGGRLEQMTSGGPFQPVSVAVVEKCLLWLRKKDRHLRRGDV